MNAPLPDDDVIASAICAAGTIALVGASAKPERPSHRVMAYLLDAGFEVVPVNPGLAGTELLGQTVYASLDAIPEPIDMVDIFLRPDRIGAVVDTALALSPRPGVIWMQLGLREDAAAARAEAAGVTAIMDRCTKIEHQRLCAATKAD